MLDLNGLGGKLTPQTSTAEEGEQAREWEYEGSHELSVLSGDSKLAPSVALAQANGVSLRRPVNVYKTAGGDARRFDVGSTTYVTDDKGCYQCPLVDGEPADEGLR